MSEVLFFAFLAFLLLAGVFFVLFRAFFIPPKTQDFNDNLAILRTQLKKLKYKKTAGVLSESEFLEATADLKKRVLEEAIPSDSPKPWQPAIATAWVLLFILPLFTLFLYFLWGNPNALSLELRDPIQFSQNQLIAALKENPKDEKALADIVALTMELQNAEQFDRALETLPAVEQLNIENAELLSLYASALWNKTGSFLGEPLKMLERAAAIDSQNPRALLFLGYALLEKGDIQRAKELLLKAKTTNHDPRVVAMIENTLADIKIRQGELSANDESAAIAQIIDLKDKILNAAPSAESQTVLLILGKAAHNLRRYDLALEIFTAAESAIPKNDAQLQAIVAGTFWRNNNLAKAKSFLESAKAADAQNPWVLFYDALFEDKVQHLKITNTMPNYLRQEIEKLQNPR